MESYDVNVCDSKFFIQDKYFQQLLQSKRVLISTAVRVHTFELKTMVQLNFDSFGELLHAD